MQFHKSLKPLVDSISKLQFSTKHKMTPSPSVNDGSIIDVITRTSCNDMYTEGLNSQIENTVDTILSEAKELLQKLGTYYQKEILEIVLHIDRLQYYFFDDQQYKGIVETVEGWNLENNEAYQLGALEYGSVETRLEPKEEFYAIIINQLERLKSELSELLFDQKEVKPIKKLEWNTKPAVLAALLEELDSLGWISPPLYHGSTSYNGLAELCDGIFTFQGTQSSLRNALSNNTLEEYKRDLITLPPLKDVQN